jgi:hypothetical protein
VAGIADFGVTTSVATLEGSCQQLGQLVASCRRHSTSDLFARAVYRRADNSRPVSFTVSAWEWVYATNLSRLQRETSKRHVGEAHSVQTIAILLPQRLSCYWGKCHSACSPILGSPTCVCRSSCTHRESGNLLWSRLEGMLSRDCC